MTSRVGIAIFSQSAAIAKGTADTVHDLVGDNVVCVYYGREPSGRLEDMIASIRRELANLCMVDGVAVLVDIGATEIAAETAIASLPREVRQKIWICDAPIVEGAIIIGTEAMSGASLKEVCGRAELLSRIQNPMAN